MPQCKKKPISSAKTATQRVGHPSIFQQAFRAWLQGERVLLLQLWNFHENCPIPPEFHDIIYDILKEASLPTPPETKRKPGRPKGTSRVHNDIQRAEIVRTVNWLRKITPRMTETHARELVAARYRISTSLVEKYCLAHRKS